MAFQGNKSGDPSQSTDDRRLSQGLFVLAGLGIIAGGLWTLYMADAPYHPEVSGGASNDVILAQD